MKSLIALTLFACTLYVAHGKPEGFRGVRPWTYGDQMDGGMGGPFDRRHKKCKWSDWETSKCLWPTTGWQSDLPNSCMNTTQPIELPDVLMHFIEGKISEEFNHYAEVLKKRNATKSCGMCSRKIRCRTSLNNDDASSQESRHYRKRGNKCPPQEMQFLDDASCDVMEPCRLTMIEGACPPPVESMMMGKGKGHGKGPGPMGGPMVGPGPMSGKGKGKGKGKMHGKGKGKGAGKRGNGDDDDSSSGRAGKGKHGDDDSSSGGADGRRHGWSGKSGSKSNSSEIFSPLDFFSNNNNANVSMTPPDWMCVANTANNACLCCCSPFMPDRETETCVNIADAFQSAIFHEIEELAKNQANTDKKSDSSGDFDEGGQGSESSEDNNDD